MFLIQKDHIGLPLVYKARKKPWKARLSVMLYQGCTVLDSIVAIGSLATYTSHFSRSYLMSETCGKLEDE